MIDLQILVNLSYGWDALDMAIRRKEIEAGVNFYVLVYWSLYMYELFFYLGPARDYATY